MFFALGSIRDFQIFELIEWSKAIAAYLLIKTLILAVDHPLSLVVFLYKVR